MGDTKLGISSNYSITEDYKIHPIIHLNRIGIINLHKYKDGFTFSIYVFREYRKMGYGNRLLEYVKKLINKHKSNLYLYLMSRGEMNNRKLSHWYKRKGFSKIDKFYYQYRGV